MDNTEENLIDFDRLWNYAKPEETEARFRELLPVAEAHPAYHAELLTQIARTHSLRRQLDEAHTVLDTVRAMLPEGKSRERVRYLLERGRAFNSSGAKAEALPLFVEAWEMARELNEDYFAIDAAHMVAIAEEPEAQLAWNLKALEVAEQTDDVRAKGWTGSLFNNIGWTYHDSGRFPEALAIFRRALGWFEAHGGNPDTIRIARWCVGRVLRSLGEAEEALSVQKGLLEERPEGSDGYVHEEIAECLLLLDRADEALPHFRRAYEALSNDAWLSEKEPTRIARLKELGEATP